MGYLLAIIGVMLLTARCETGDSVQPNPGQDVEIRPPSSDSNAVCNAFGDSQASQANYGLLSDLYYLSDDQPRYSNTSDYLNFGHFVNQNSLYFNRLFIPTRPFDRGFVTQGGETILNANGNTLYEYFALHLESQLALSSEEFAGDYQVALLADDGAVIQVDDSGTGNYRVLVNDDGTHPTKMSCATTPITMDVNSRIPIKVNYYQGPRFHIAMIMMWRPWPTNPADVNDPLCGTSGNSRFFDSTFDPPKPQVAYTDLLARGWRPLVTQNFVLPPSAPTNPCASNDPLVLTGAAVSAITQTTATFTWTSNNPSTSQVELTNVATGAKTTTALDSSLVTDHNVVASGLLSNTLYSFQVVSTTSTGELVRSDPIAFRTLR